MTNSILYLNYYGRLQLQANGRRIYCDLQLRAFVSKEALVWLAVELSLLSCSSLTKKKSTLDALIISVT